MSRIEQSIAEIEEYVSNCKFSPLSNTKLVVNRDEIEELIDNLKHNVPDEIKTYQKIISNREAILQDAQDKSEEMIRKANEMTMQLVSEHEIMQQAYKEANKLIEEATEQADAIVSRAASEANDYKLAAIRYTDDTLADFQNLLNSSIESFQVHYDDLQRSMKSSLEVTIQNRRELKQDEAQQEEAYRPAEESAPAAEPVYGENAAYSENAQGSEPDEANGQYFDMQEGIDETMSAFDAANMVDEREGSLSDSDSGQDK